MAKDFNDFPIPVGSGATYTFETGRIPFAAISGAAAATAPTLAAAQANAGRLAAGAYRYAVSFVDANGPPADALTTLRSGLLLVFGSFFLTQQLQSQLQNVPVLGGQLTQVLDGATFQPLTPVSDRGELTDVESLAAYNIEVAAESLGDLGLARIFQPTSAPASEYVFPSSLREMPANHRISRYSATSGIS